MGDDWDVRKRMGSEGKARGEGEERVRRGGYMGEGGGM